MPTCAASPKAWGVVLVGRTLVDATLVEREGRFVARCRVGRRAVRAHLACTGRLGGLLVAGAPVLLEPKAPSPTRASRYTLVAVEQDGAWVHLESAAASAVVADLLTSGRITLASAPRVASVRREVTLGRSRFDLAVTGARGEEVWVEVKACTELSESFAMFPDGATERGRRHVEALDALARRGARAAVVFLAQSARPRWFLPDHHVDPAFAAALERARARVEIAAFGVTSDRAGATVVRRLDIPWSLYAREAGNRGAYLLHLVLDRPRTLVIGARGPVNLPAGHYLYVGSALKNLDQRVARHRRLTKKLHWHIDYLRAAARVVGAYPIRTPDDLEHVIAAEARALADASVPGFGCSDCACPSHLLYFADDPTARRPFWTLLHHLRAERLAGDAAPGPSF